MKRLTFTLLLFCTVFLTACDKTTPQEIPDDTNRSTVFSEQILSVPDDWKINNFPALTFDGERLSVDIWREIDVDNDGNGWPDQEFNRAYFDTDGTFLSVGGDSGQEDAETAFSPRRDGRIIDTAELPSGETLVYETLYTDYEVGCYVHHYDEKGGFVRTLLPAEAFGYELHRDTGNMSGDVFSVEKMLSVPGVGEDAPARYGILTTEGFAVYDDTGSLSFKISDGGGTSAILDTDAGLLFLSENKQGKQSLRKIDTAVGKLGAEITLPEELTAQTLGSTSTKLLSGAGYDLYAYNGRGLYGVNFTDAALNTSSTLVIDWAESNLAPSDIRTVCMIDDKTAAIVTADLLDYTRASVLSLYRMVPADEVIPKREIVIAKLVDDFMVQFAVRDFNRASDTHRAVIRDYTQYSDDQKKLAFDTDLAAGKVPDLILMGTWSPEYDTLVSTYERSGILTDLTPLMQADADFNYDGLLGYITKPYQYYGKQYLFPIAPVQNLLFGHAEDFGEGGAITHDEFLSVMESCADKGQAIANRMTPWSIILESALHEQYDEKTAVCTFDDGTLSALAARARAIPLGNENIPTDINSEELFRTGQVRLCKSDTGFTSLYEYVTETKSLGEDAVVVGYPTEDGVMSMGSSGITVVLAVTETSTEKAASVDFLQTLIDIKRERTHNDRSASMGYTFYREDIEKQLAAYDGKTIIVNGRIKKILPDEEAVGEPGVHFKLTPEDADAFARLLDSIERRVNNNTPAATIFLDEYYAAAYSGDKPFEEVLKIVQSKMSIYLSEQMD